MKRVSYILEKIKELEIKIDARTLNTNLQLLYTVVLRVLSLLINFSLVPITISYVNVESYGLWLVLSSIIGWFALFDVGLGHGLRNKLTEALANKDLELAKIYTSTAYGLIGIISISVGILLIVITPYINWDSLLNTTVISQEQMSLLVLILISYFCLQFVLRLITTVLTADQKPSIPVLLNLLANCTVLFLLYFNTNTEEGTLIQLSLIYSLPILTILFISTFFLFNSRYKLYRPSILFFRFKYAKNLGGLGIKFFALQIEMLVLIQLANYLIISFFGSSEVVQYNIAYKYFMVVQLLLATVMNTYWSAFTDAITLNDMKWIKNTMQNLRKVWFILVPISLLMLIFSNDFYHFWVGDVIEIPFIISVSMCLWILIEAWNSIFEYFLNAASKLYIALTTALITSIIYLPLTFFMIKKLEFGVEGIVIAVIICRLINALILPVQYKLVINNKAQGFWNK